MDDEKKTALSIATFPALFHSISRLMRVVWHEQRGLFIGMVATSLVIAVLPFANSGVFALFINALVKGVKGGVTASHIWFLVGLVVATMVVPDINAGLSSFLNRRLYRRMVEWAEMKLIHKKGELDIGRLEDPAFQDLLNKASERGLSPVPNLIEAQFMNLENIITVVIASVVVISAYPLLFILVFVGLVPQLLIGLKYGHSIWGVFDANSQDRRRYQNLRRHFNYTSNLINLKLVQGVPRFTEMIGAFLRNFNRQQEDVETERFHKDALAWLFSGCAFGGGFAYLAAQVLHGHLQIGTLTFLLAAMNRLSHSLEGFFNYLARQYEWGLFVSGTFQVLDTEPAIVSPPCAVVVKNHPPHIVFEDVRFNYPGVDIPILKGVSLDIAPGASIALVGENGSGKTTLIKLLCRFYDPTGGRILVDGTDLREINLEAWLSMLGVLSQRYDQYNFKVREEIEAGRFNGFASLKDIIAAAQAGQAHNFINKLPEGYHTQIGRKFDGGIDPSQGQLQRLALSRMLYREPKVLVLDEPTASVDAKAERDIFDHFRRSRANRVTIMIAQHFAAIRGADTICVLKDGVVCEQGAHKSLMDIPGGVYRDLFTMQADGYAT